MIKASPTEYKRIKMRSKSEAIFARCLDLTCGSGSENEPSFIYEPNTINNQFSLGRSWDFLVFREWNGVRIAILIELKPSLPTDTYVEKIRSIAATDVKRFLTCEIAKECELAIVLIHGSAWSKVRSPYSIEVLSSSVSLARQLQSLEKWLGINSKTLESASAYRFDLHAKANANTRSDDNRNENSIYVTAPNKSSSKKQATNSAYLKTRGIYHAVVLCVNIEKYYERGFEKPIANGFSVTMEVIGGVHSDKKFQLVFWGERLDLPDDHQVNLILRRKQFNFAVACDLIDPKCFLTQPKEIDVNFNDAIGSQVILEIDTEKYYTEDNKKRKRMSLVDANIFHIDDPKSKKVSCFELDAPEDIVPLKGAVMNEKLLAAIPDVNRHGPEYFDQIQNVSFLSYV